MKQERVEITLKKFKELHKYTLFEMSEHTGLSIALLSKIINNQVAISDASKIAFDKAYPDFLITSSVEPPSQMSDKWRRRYVAERIANDDLSKTISLNKTRINILEHKLRLVSNVLSRNDIPTLYKDLKQLDEEMKIYMSDNYVVVAIADDDGVVLHYLIEADKYGAFVNKFNEQVNYYIEHIQHREEEMEYYEVDSLYEYLHRHVFDEETGIRIEFLYL